MIKYIFLEGLPGVGKTTIINTIREKHLHGVFVVDEIVNEKILSGESLTEFDFIENDMLKFERFSDGVVVLDRGPISSLSYSQVKKLLKEDYDISKAEESFLKLKHFLDDGEVVYLTNEGTSYLCRENDEMSPYGTIENQKLLEKITLENIEKYCKKYKILKYHKDDIEWVINEILN